MNVKSGSGMWSAVCEVYALCVVACVILQSLDTQVSKIHLQDY
jgi:hypothetical protein